jgi:MoxR-like ATPase
LIYVIPSLEGQEIARELLRADLERSQSGALKDAVEDASHGLIARAERIQVTALELLDHPPRGAQSEAGHEPLTPDDSSALRRWRLRLEGVARELDATFNPTTLPESLSSLRERIVTTLERS